MGSTLLLAGDAFGNALVVSTATGGRMAVLGGLGTTINGSTSPFVTSRAVTSIVANLNAGNDVVGFSNNADGFLKQLASCVFSSPFSPALQDSINTATGNIPTFSLPGGLAVTTASGDDFVGIIGTVGGSVAANLGSASTRNGFVIGDPSGNAAVNRVGGGVAMVGGAQEDRVTLFGTTVVGGVSAALGDGVNLVGVLGYGASLGSLAYTGGKGNDLVGLQQDLAVRNGVSIFTGPQGEDVVDLFPGVTVGGSVVVNTGIGADDDFVFSDGLTTRYNLFVYLGPGNDQLELYNARAFAAFLYGGTGTNTLSSDPATRAGIRTLRWFPFQTVNFFQ